MSIATILKAAISLASQIKNSRYFIPILLLVLIIPTFSFLLRPGIYWNMHDDMQMVRQLEFEKCLSDGQIPCRWSPDLAYGYGYPLFNFYPSFPYIVGQVIRFTGATFVDTIKYTAVLQIVLSTFFMYLLSSSLFGPIGGLISALFYAYAPYHAVDIYIRGAMDEAWAAVFFPLILFYSKKLIETSKPKYILGLSLSFTCLLLSHNPMVLIFSPIVVVWSLYWLYIQKSKKTFKPFKIFFKLFLSACLSLGLAAYFTLPVLFESKLVQIDSMFTNYYTYSIHFASVFQLFISNFWGDGPSVWGTNDGMSFSIGYLHWIIPTILLIILILKYLRQRRLSKIESSVVGLVLSAYFFAFLSHERSTFIWKLIPIIQKIQFPWRILNITTFLFSLASGYLAFIIYSKKLSSRLSRLLLSVVIVLLLFLNINHFTPIISGPITDGQKFSGQAWVNQVTGGIYDYLPKTALQAPQRPANDYLDQVVPASAKYSLSGQKKGTDWQFFNLNLSQPATIYLSIIAFPSFTITDYQQPIEYQIDPIYGRLMLSLNAGQHQIYVKLQNTFIRTLSNYLSIASVFIVIFLILPQKWKQRK